MIKDAFLKLIRLGVGNSSEIHLPMGLYWRQIDAIAARQGLSALLVDGVEKLYEDERPPKDILLQWIGETIQSYENRYKLYQQSIASLASFYKSFGIKMMVLKGYACSLDWPRPEHRPCGDIDIWLFGKQNEADAALAASTKFQDSGSKIDKSHHHHTVFEWKGFTVENHYDFINVHHHRSHRGLENIFKELGKDESHYVEVCGEKIYVPSPNLHALFLLRHALNHFASIGINLRNVLDWAFYIDKHFKEIDWKWLDNMIDEYHMRDFYNCLNAICVEDLGFNPVLFHSEQFLPEMKRRVLNDILDPEFTIEEPDGFCKKWFFKYRRWKGNRWKQKLCYKESAWSAFRSGMMVHIKKPYVK